MNLGDRFAGYEIVGILGSGAMGQVYKVRNLLSERIEAMKVLLPDLEGNAELSNRFQREIRIQAGLNHPNIARLQTAQQIGRELLMVMEYVDGTTLEKILIQQGSLSPEHSIAYASQLLDALAYAHSRGAVHRDIKPTNIMVTHDGQIKLMDFGIACMTADRHLTRTGHTVGTVFYMSPEQITGGQLDARSDIYSFGITLYEMVTGRRPFQGDSDFSIMTAHCQQTPQPPLEIIPEIPTELSNAILKAIAKDREGRFQRAEDFRLALLNVQCVPPAPDSTSIQDCNQPFYSTSPRNTIDDRGQADHDAAPWDAAPQLPDTAIDNKFRGHRTLYMALGSVLTLGILMVAGVEGPRLLRSGSTGASAPRAQASSGVEISSTPDSYPAEQPPMPPQYENGGSSVSAGVTLPSSSPGTSTSAASLIGGTVTDSSGEIVMGATVIVRNTETGAAYTAMTDGHGRYVVPAMGTGIYQVEVEAAGLKKSVHNGITLAGGRQIVLDAVLQPGTAQRTPPRSVKQQPYQEFGPVPSQSESPGTTQKTETKDLRDRFASLQARFAAADDELEILSNQLKLEGVSLRPSLSLARNTAKVKLEQAQSEIAAGEIVDAQKSLDDVEVALGDIERIRSR
jgi:serine/threonine protein kinase